MTDTTPTPTEIVFSPTQDLILEVLIARYRLGENCWTFNSNLTKQMLALEDLGYVTWKSGIIYKTVLVWLTDKGKKEFLSNTYEAPILKNYKKKKNK